MYRLKKGVESFRVMDGPYEGRKFLKGKEYAEVPPGEALKFEEVEKQGAGSREQGVKSEKKAGIKGKGGKS